jgi:hydrogenase maturation protein HypF
LWDAEGIALFESDAALRRVMEIVRDGQILAIKGIGGFQLIVDSGNEGAVQRLRERKRRAEKPFALMYPSLHLVQEDCQVSELEARLLVAPEAPIVLLHRKSSKSPFAPAVAPGSPSLGVMLPYSPLHHLLMRDLGFPIVATSGNLSEEPICIDEYEASSEGNAAMRPGCRCPFQKQCRFGRGKDIFISQHIGDLETSEAFSAFCRTAEDLPRLCEAQPSIIACDMHPDYLSTKQAARTRLPLHRVQHHFAHVLAGMADNELENPVLGVSWDGTGYGTDGSIWGGEFLLIDEESFRRVAHFRQFRLPGGDIAVREPRRTALGVLYEIWGDKGISDRRLAPITSFSESELVVIRQMLSKGVRSPITSSAGRLFDAVASIVGLRQRVTFEGQAAMELEFAIEQDTHETYPFELTDGLPSMVDWAPMIAEMLLDLQKGESSGRISAIFHNTLAEIIVAIARRVGEPRILLTGGCFQNRYLVEHAVRRLSDAGFKPYWHQRVPPNDGGIALGQVVAVARSRAAPAQKGVEVP